MFDAKVMDSNFLKTSIGTIGELIDEGVFRVKKDGIYFTATDRAMVVVADFCILAPAFDEYKVEKEEEIGINIQHLLSILKRAGPQDSITLSMKEQSKLEVRMDNASKRKFSIPIIETEKNDIPPLSDLTFTATVEMNSKAFEDGIADAEIVSDASAFIANGSGFTILSEGDTSKAELTLEKDSPSLIKCDAGDEVRSKYAVEYLKKIGKASKLADTALLEFGENYPLKITFKQTDKFRLSFVLAPRVSED